jgi:Rap1a immunity proteins
MNKKMLGIFAVLLLAACTTAPARAAADDASGTMFYQSCMAAASIIEGSASTDALDKAPMCFGAMTAIINLEPFLKPEAAMCPPKGTKITYAQMILVVAKYLKTHPEQLHENFHMLAMLALHEAWPCSTTTP